MSRHSLKILSICSTVAIILAFPSPGLAAADMYLKIEGINGESQDRDHKGEIEVLSWSWGMSQNQPATGASRRAAGAVCIEDMNLTKYHDASSADLYNALANGKHYPSATLTMRKAGQGQQNYVVIEMKNVNVRSVSTGSSGSEDRMTENLLLSFQQVAGSYAPQAASGTAGQTKSWSVQDGHCY